MEIRQGNRQEDDGMNRAEERIAALELALKSSKGAQDEMGQMLSEIAEVVRSRMMSDTAKVQEIGDLVRGWAGDE